MSTANKTSDRNVLRSVPLCEEAKKRQISLQRSENQRKITGLKGNLYHVI